MTSRCPRLVIAGTAGDSGKTLVTMGLLAAWRHQGLSPAPFKKGPDYIDAAWLSWAAGTTCRNLDTFMQPPEALLGGFRRHASPTINLVEGNRGLHDGADAAGSHSTATLAALLDAPVILVVPVTKVTRTAAAMVLGCQQLDPRARIAGVILNRVGGPRHHRVVRQAVEEATGLPVLGALPRIVEELLPDRHLGLVPPEERGAVEGLADRLRRHIEDHADGPRLLELAGGAAALPAPEVPAVSDGAVEGRRVRIGVFSDSAFTFYYPENLEALSAAGAEIVRVSGLADNGLPSNLDGLYLGGGFPETHVRQLSANEELHRQLREAAESGMPMYAECGGLIYLARSLTCEDERYPMAGVLPIEVELHPRPQGHGYVEAVVDRPNPFFPEGVALRGHEFHYTSIRVSDGDEVATALRLSRGTGALGGRDGIVYKNVLAGYTHLHALGVPLWAPSLVSRAAAYADRRAGNSTE